MQKEDPLPAALNKLLGLNWLHEDFPQQIATLSQQVTPWPAEEIGYLLHRAQERKAKRAHNRNEPLGFFLAEILIEMAQAFVAEAKRYWTISERCRFHIAYPLVAEQYLQELDGRVPRARVIKCLSDATRLRQVHKLSCAEADEVCAEVQAMSASTYSNRRWDGIVLLAQAVKTAVEDTAPEETIHAGHPEPKMAFRPEPALAVAANGPVKYVPQPELSWLDNSGWVIDETTNKPLERGAALGFIEPNTIFWVRLLQTGRQVMIFNEAWVIDQANGLKPETVKMQLRLMEKHNLIRRVTGGSEADETDQTEIWYSVTDKSWRRLGVPFSGEERLSQPPNQTGQMPFLRILPQLDIGILPVIAGCTHLLRFLGTLVKTYLHNRFRQVEAGWQWDVGVGMAYILLAVGLLAGRLSPYLVLSVALVLYWMQKKYGQSRRATSPFQVRQTRQPKRSSK